MKRHEMIFSVVRVPTDITVCIGSFFMARTIRETGEIFSFDVSYRTIDTPDLLFFALIACLVFVMSLAISRLYHVELSSSRIRELAQVSKALVVGFFVYVGLIYFANGILYETPIPRLLLAMAFLLCLVGILISRIFFNTLQLWLLKKRILAPRNLLLLLGKNTRFPVDDLIGGALYEVIGTMGEPYEGLAYLGDLSDLKSVIQQNQINDVFCLTPHLSYEQESEIVRVVKNLGIKYRYLTHLSEASHKNTDIQLVGDTPLVEIRSSGMSLWGRILKRVLDFFLALVLLIVLLPVLIVLCVIIRSETPGSPLYIDRRVGKNGKIFRLYKLRSMYKDAGKLKEEILKKNQRMDGPLFKIDDDPRVTKSGRWIRRYSIDELPNLINVILGDMSLIGPRPHLPEEVAKYDDDQSRVLTVKPGVTGMAQVNGRHSNSFAREIELDIFYIEHWSFVLDAKIFFKTIGAMFGGR